MVISGSADLLLTPCLPALGACFRAEAHDSQGTDFIGAGGET